MSLPKAERTQLQLIHECEGLFRSQVNKGCLTKLSEKNYVQITPSPDNNKKLDLIKVTKEGEKVLK